jgi:hypothetical protein
MAYSATGVYQQVSGAITAVPGQVVQSAVWDNIHTDIGAALTQVMQQLVTSITNRNIVWMNGGFEVWQRGAGNAASFAVLASTTQYTADRWYITTGANQASTVAAVAGINTFGGSRLAAAVQRNAAQTGIGTYAFGYPLDQDECIALIGQKIALSCLISAGANFSPASGQVNVDVFFGTGAPTKRQLGGAFTNEQHVLSASLSGEVLGGAATLVTAKGTVAVAAGTAQGEIQFTWTPTGTAGAADTVNFDDLQIEPQTTLTLNSSNVWTITNYDRISFKDMLDGCMRHYQKTFQYGIAPAQNSGSNVSALAALPGANQNPSILWILSPHLRIVPAVTLFNPAAANANWRDITAGADVVASFDTTVQGSKAILIYGVTSTATTSTSHTLLIHAQADSAI